MAINNIIFKIKRILLRLINFGFKMRCPICNGHFRRFLPMNERENAVCPKCRSLERTRLIFLCLKQKNIFLRKNLRLLHVAPHKMLQRILGKMRNLEYISINIVPGLANYAMDLTNLTFENNFFDIIICSHVLEHISDDKLAIKELYRVLKEDGWGLIIVPIDSNLENTIEGLEIKDLKIRKELFGLEDHVRQYGLDFIDRLRNAGFYVKLDNYINDLDESTLKKFGLNTDEKIYFVSKYKD